METLIWIEFVDPVSERPETQAEQIGRLVFVSVGALHSLFYICPFNFFENGVQRHAVGHLIDVEPPVSNPLDPSFFVDRHGQTVRQQDIGIGQGHASFDQVFQFTDIAGKIIFLQQIDGLGRKFGDLLTQFLRILFQKMLGQRQQVALAFS